MKSKWKREHMRNERGKGREEKREIERKSTNGNTLRGKRLGYKNCPVQSLPTYSVGMAIWDTTAAVNQRAENHVLIALCYHCY